MGGMTLGVAHNEHENVAYTQNKDVKDTVFLFSACVLISLNNFKKAG